MMTNTPPDFRIRYNKNKKSTGKPIVVWDIAKDVEYFTDSFDMTNCDIKMYFGNAIKQEKYCGTTTSLLVWKR